jgi:hypothetical protein
VLPHGDQRLFRRRGSEQARLGLDRLEVTTDGDDFADHRPVVEDQGRHGALGIDGKEFRLELGTGHQVDLLHRHLDAFFGQENAHPARIGGRREIVELHRDLLSVAPSRHVPGFQEPRKPVAALSSHGMAANAT